LLSSTTLSPLVANNAKASTIVLSLLSVCEAAALGALDPILPFPFATIVPIRPKVYKGKKD
jgi:hypothetical protein